MTNIDLRGRDLLTISDLSRIEFLGVLDLARRIKAGEWRERPLAGKHVCLIFQRPSHRTRVSFEVGISKLGGRSVVLGEAEIQLGVREPIIDAAGVLDRYVDGIVARLRTHADLVRMAEASVKPVVNALTDLAHPCQALADALTLLETCGGFEDRKVAYVGDGNNVAHSLIESSALLGFPLAVVTPPDHAPDPELVERARSLAGGASHLTVTTDLGAVEGAAAVYTDVWASMGQEGDRERRRTSFLEYQVNGALMALAPEAVFMHCLPAHRGEEVAAEVIDGPRSVVYEQAGNRLHAQMALLALLLGD